MTPDAITAAHLARLAYIYIRQSSEHQVRPHRESQRRQRGLVERALELGWPRDRIVLIDDDLGQSAGRASARASFDQLVADAALGRVGIIMALEVSRLTRGSAAWYHLLDICAITATLIGDAEGPRCAACWRSLPAGTTRGSPGTPHAGRRPTRPWARRCERSTTGRVGRTARHGSRPYGSS